MKNMKQEFLTMTFEKSWFPREDTVDGLLRRLDLEERIPLSIFKEACKKEGRKFIINYK